MKIDSLKTDYRVKPVGIDSEIPRFSWKLRGNEKNAIQRSYRIRAWDAKTEEMLWDSGKVESRADHAVCWEGKKLRSGQKVMWLVISEVEAETETGNKISTVLESQPEWFEMGLLRNTDWKAFWIEPEDTVDPFAAKPAQYLRKEFRVRKGVKRARIYQSAHGLYEFWINGIAGTKDKFKPGFTSYHKRTQYQTYDITELIREGDNCWAAALGDGWWRGTVGGQSRNTFGDKVAYIGQIEIIYEDGTCERVVTDESFLCGTGEILANDMMLGEICNASAEPTGWKECGFSAESWRKAFVAEQDREKKLSLVASNSVPVREKEILEPEVLHTPDGMTVLDFKQNIAGYVYARFRNCKKGERIVMIHGEALDENGNFTQKNYAQTELAENNVTQKTEYIAKGDEIEAYCPMFSVFGFRYVQIQGYNGPIRRGDFRAAAVYSDMEVTGRFHCSDPLIDRLAENCLWSQKGNFMDVPTDCPTRERNPYTGDAQVYAGTAAYFMDVYPFFEKWMKDYTAEQFLTGKIPNTVPSISAMNHNEKEEQRRNNGTLQMEEGPMKDIILAMAGSKGNGSFIDGSSGWADAVTIIPYIMFHRYGDIRIYENQYECCRKWIDYISGEAKKANPIYKDLPYYENPKDAEYVWDTGFHWGEWLEPDMNIYDDMWGYIGKLMKYPEYLSATMFYYYSAKIVSEMAEKIGKKEDAEKYQILAQKIKKVYNKYFISDEGVIAEGRQALHARALAFGLVEEEKKKKVAEYLFELVRDNGYALNTGFLSTQYLTGVLADNGYPEAAYKLLERTEYPGWLEAVKDGATTIPETWGGYERCSGSYNHYSYGAVSSFLFAYIGGIRIDESEKEDRKIVLSPLPGGNLNHAESVYESIHGTIRSSWTKMERNIEYTFTLPVNTRAQICIRGTEADFNRIKKKYPESEWNDGKIKICKGSGTWKLNIGEKEDIIN